VAIQFSGPSARFRLHSPATKFRRRAFAAPPQSGTTVPLLGAPPIKRERLMGRRLLTWAAAWIPLILLPATAGATSDYRVSGPHTHANLTIYLVHGQSSSGPVPLTLEEAMAKRTVVVRETGRVNELEIENLGNEEVFVQSGDIVKGGQQDRVLMVSLLVPPRSGPVQIASFCVEQGRWSARGKEDAARFSTAATAVPSREAKMAMKAPVPLAYMGGAEVSQRQQEVWKDVAKVQKKIGDNLGTMVASPQSRSSLQLTLENEKLAQEQAGYVTALQAAGERDGDVIGYVFAINGKLNSADLYPSNALFRKMWVKLLRANATEAIGERNGASEPLPVTDTVSAFLTAAESGKTTEKALTPSVRLESRDGDKALFFETRRDDGGWVHRNYLAK
jgi:hypothetical protein